MDRIKLSEQFLKTNALGELIIELREYDKKLSLISKRLESCYTQDFDGSEPVIDPFKLKDAVNSIECDPSTVRILGLEKITNLKEYSILESDKVISSFETRIRSFCDKLQIKLDGHFPSYFLNGFLPVEVIEKKDICRVGTREVKSLLLESIAPSILESIKTENARQFNLSSLLEEMYIAYQRIINIRKLNFGETIPIKDLFYELVLVKQSAKFKNNPIKSNFTDYLDEFFERDLAKLMISSPNVVKAGKKLSLTPTSFSSEGVPILADGAIRFIGRIAFLDMSS